MFYKNVLFSKDMAIYTIFILVPNKYNPILNIKAAMCTKGLQTIEPHYVCTQVSRKKAEFILFPAFFILVQHMEIDNLYIKLSFHAIKMRSTGVSQFSKLDFRIYWPENFKIRIFI